MEGYNHEEEYQKRLAKINKAISEALDSLDPESETYFEDLATIKELESEVAKDFKNYGDLKDKEEKNGLIEKRQAQEAEEAQDKKTSSLIENVISAGLVGVSLISIGVTIWSELKRDKRFKRATAFEKENAILTLTDRKAVEEGLKEHVPSKGIFSHFGK